MQCVAWAADLQTLTHLAAAASAAAGGAAASAAAGAAHADAAAESGGAYAAAGDAVDVAASGGPTGAHLPGQGLMKQAGQAVRGPPDAPLQQL